MLGSLDPIQAGLASRIVILHFTAGECFRLATLPDIDWPYRHRWMMQGTSLNRLIVRLTEQFNKPNGGFGDGDGFTITPMALTLATMAAAAGGGASAARDAAAGEHDPMHQPGIGPASASRTAPAGREPAPPGMQNPMHQFRDHDPMHQPGSAAPSAPRTAPASREPAPPGMQNPMHQVPAANSGPAHLPVSAFTDELLAPLMRQSEAAAEKDPMHQFEPAARDLPSTARTIEDTGPADQERATVAGRKLCAD